MREDTSRPAPAGKLAEGKPALGKSAVAPAWSGRACATRPLAALLPRVMQRAVGRRGFGEGAILTDWPAIVGESIAAVSAPERLSFSPGTRRDAVLQVRVAGPMALELQHLEPQILERINGHFGYQAVARLRIVQGPLPPRARPAAPSPAAPLNEADEAQLAEGLARVDDDALRQALEGLGRAVLGRGRTAATPARRQGN